MSPGFTGILHHLHLPADALDPSGRALLPLFFRIPADLIAFAGGRGGGTQPPAAAENSECFRPHAAATVFCCCCSLAFKSVTS